MMDFQQSLGVKSYCFRQFKEPATLARMVRDCGVDHIDLSACHVDFDSRPAQEKLLAAMSEAGITVVGIGVVGFRGEEAYDRRFFEFCKLAGCRTISINFEPAAQDRILALAPRLCAEYGMRCAIHNHGGKHWLGNSQMLRHLFSTAADSIGLCLDTAWAIDAGEDPVAWATATGPRLMATHLKDFTFDLRGNPHDVFIGDGALNVPAYVQALQALNFNGPFVVEYEADADNPVPALTQCVTNLRRVLG